MALSSAAVTVSTSATALHSEAKAYGHVLVQNLDATADLYVGDSAVTTSSGVKVTAGRSVTVQVRPGDRLYGIVASSTLATRVLSSEL